MCWTRENIEQLKRLVINRPPFVPLAAIYTALGLFPEETPAVVQFVQVTMSDLRYTRVMVEGKRGYGLVQSE